MLWMKRAEYCSQVHYKVSKVHSMLNTAAHLSVHNRRRLHGADLRCRR